MSSFSSSTAPSRNEIRRIYAESEVILRRAVDEAALPDELEQVLPADRSGRRSSRNATVDSIVFLSAASGTAPWFIEHPPSFAQTGIDASFVGFSIPLVLAIAAGGFMLRELARMRQARPAS